jgi:hypothetical protein
MGQYTMKPACTRFCPPRIADYKSDGSVVVLLSEACANLAIELESDGRLVSLSNENGGGNLSS